MYFLNLINKNLGGDKIFYMDVRKILFKRFDSNKSFAVSYLYNISKNI